jgi:hypothetical protein
MNLLGAYLGHGMGGGGSITPSYGSIEGAAMAGQASPSSAAGGTNLPFGLGNYGGVSPYNATYGGWNMPWGGNIGGSDVPYIGGPVSTPSGSAYGGGPTPYVDPFAPTSGGD